MSIRSWWRLVAAAGFVFGVSAGARASGAEPAPRVTDGLVSGRSDSPPADGVYGRFDGDLDLSLAVGGAVVTGGSGGAAMLRALFLGTTGLYVAYNDAFGKATSAPPRSLALGLGVRPLFLPRWGNNLDRGPAVLDLTLDAITFDMGVVWSSDDRGRFTQRPGLELALGTEVPLLGQAWGPWAGLRGALRWRGAELSGSSDADPVLDPVVFVTLAWHFVANAHVVDRGDEILR